MFGRALVASVLVASAATAAHADQRRGGMTGGAMVGGGPATSERFTGPTVKATGPPAKSHAAASTSKPPTSSPA